MQLVKRGKERIQIDTFDRRQVCGNLTFSKESLSVKNIMPSQPGIFGLVGKLIALLNQRGDIGLN